MVSALLRYDECFTGRTTWAAQNTPCCGQLKNLYLQESLTMNWLRELCRDDSGATMVEYGIMIALIAAVCIAAVTNIGTSINTAFNNLVTALAG